jgi:hypothetical protein
MFEIQKELDNTLNDLKNFINNINEIDSINEFNTMYAKIKNYENNIIKINKTIQKIILVKDSLNIVLNNYILKKIHKTQIYKLNDNNKNISKLTPKNTTKNNKNISKDSIKPNININYKNVTNDIRYNNINFVKFPIINISIDNLDIIENTPIYCINETQQYCIKINNNLIMGNIGNIYSKKNDAEKINKCKYTDCNNKFYGKECRYYHNNINRNFTNYSWNHINKNKDGKLDIKNNITKYDEDNSRFIGSLNTLMEDLPYSSANEKDLRNSQLMHDILLFIVLSEYLIH